MKRRRALAASVRLPPRTAAWVLAACAASCMIPDAALGAGGLVPFRVEGDEIRAPLGGLTGDAARGRALFMSRESNCSLCHLLPDGDPRFMGNVGPPLAGLGKRFTQGQLRLRIVDSSRINPQSVMPAYYRTEGLKRVAKPYAGKPVFSAQEVEDMVAFLTTIR